MPKRLALLLYIALVWCCFNNTPTYCLANETDRLALISFKGSIDQDPFGALNSWNDSLHYCDWEGIACSRRHRDRVTELNLRSQGLVGSLSPHIGNLSFLRIIVLQNNSFHGPVPQEIGRLFRLRALELSNNSFGQIPKNLSSCSNLEYLNLIDNHLTGNIPGELGSLAKLEALGLGINNLSGTIPLSLMNLSSLSKVSLLECNLHGEIPAEINRLQTLRFVQLGNNNLSGKIPSGLFNISTISYLDVDSNKLHGSISFDTGSSTFALTNLQRIYLYSNQFAGMIPTSLLNATGLEEIDLSKNSFTGPMPKDLGKISCLQSINVGKIKCILAILQPVSQPFDQIMLGPSHLDPFRPSEDRTIPLSVIAERTKLTVEDVEYLLMKSLSVHLIEGIIDQVEGTVHVSWVQPRVLGISQIKSLRDRLDNWVDKVHTALLSVEAETPDLVAA
ncbi:hypothetical protein Vadar_011245 [Vaccinium darrowii]|uniref:Uncharacterized protein n=1 Tax=Vaccinium darrowii TaxID=229202 RepID=A0ACB7WZV1_9ERIC|nr:hypothetical protein Vadar_011245 [Vaccinium darrowii]